VQELFERYLEERGVNSALALFVPEYAEHKEQKVSVFVPLPSSALPTLSIHVPIYSRNTLSGLSGSKRSLTFNTFVDT
jgi:hypothetical protein